MNVSTCTPARLSTTSLSPMKRQGIAKDEETTATTTATATTETNPNEMSVSNNSLAAAVAAASATLLAVTASVHQSQPYHDNYHDAASSSSHYASAATLSLTSSDEDNDESPSTMHQDHHYHHGDYGFDNATVISSSTTATATTKQPSKHDIIWNEMFQRLVQYKEIHGDCLVPQTYAQDTKLGRWVLTQRQKNKRLPPERRKRLVGIGFVWHSSQQSWDEMYNRLVRYKQLHGDCLVPQNYAHDTKLGRWVHKQRERRRSSLSYKRVQRLDNIGFVWSSQAATWENMFSKLSRYRDTVGDCRVPYNYDLDPPLGRWVYLQRKHKCHHSIDRIKKLESLGFEWK